MVRIETGMVTATCATEGAVIGWTAVPPQSEQKSVADNPFMGFGKAVGNPEVDGRSWQLYNQPFEAPGDCTLWFRAHRLGYLESDEMALNFSSA